MSIRLPDLTRQDVLTAIEAIDKGTEHNFGKSTKYDLVYQGRRYAPKAVVGLAAESHIGRPLVPRDFSGGEESRCFKVLLQAGFDIRLKVSSIQYAVITENDVSQWQDETGRQYHFPKRYEEHLVTGTEVVYYTGKLKHASYAETRLSPHPHYFAFARIGEVKADKNSTKGDLFAEIIEFSPLLHPVLSKSSDSYLEPIPENRKTNYWRDGVREIEKATYLEIRKLASSRNALLPEEFNDRFQGESKALQSGVDGIKKKQFVTVYERDPKLRNEAVALHGTRCCICKFDFEEFYGEVGSGYIHIHHIKPVATLDGPTEVVPSTDLVPVCANCHSIIHRRRDRTLSIAEMQRIILHTQLVSPIRWNREKSRRV